MLKLDDHKPTQTYSISVAEGALSWKSVMTLADRQWSEGCYVERGEIGFYMVVSSTRQAMLVLSRYWPVHEGEAYFEALRIIGQVMMEKLPPDDAKEAFVAAAKEGGVPVSDVPLLLKAALV